MAVNQFRRDISLRFFADSTCSKRPRECNLSEVRKSLPLADPGFLVATELSGCRHTEPEATSDFGVGGMGSWPLARRGAFGFADGFLPAGFLAAAGLAGLLIILMRPKLAFHAAALQQLLESAQRRTDVFPVMNPHTKSHSASFGVRCVKTLKRSCQIIW